LKRRIVGRTSSGSSFRAFGEASIYDSEQAMDMIARVVLLAGFPIALACRSGTSMPSTAPLEARDRQHKPDTLLQDVKQSGGATQSVGCSSVPATNPSGSGYD